MFAIIAEAEKGKMVHRRRYPNMKNKIKKNPLRREKTEHTEITEKIEKKKEKGEEKNRSRNG